jgi:hypothetical protein
LDEPKKVTVAKILIDVNEDDLAAAQQVLHTETKKTPSMPLFVRSLPWMPGGAICGGLPQAACLTWPMRM